jgi:outer membrane protein assembly factor BamD
MIVFKENVQQCFQNRRLNMSTYKKILISTMFIFIITGACYAFWEWTPETGGRFIGLGRVVKDTPEEQFSWAMQFYNAEDYKRAIIEFRRLYKTYPDSVYASRAKFYEGKSQEKLGNYWQAFQAYQRMIDKYPHADIVPEAVKRAFNIGEIFLAGRRIRKMGMEIFPSTEATIEIFRSIVKTAPFGPYGAKAQFNLGLAYKRAGRFAQAREAFLKVIDEYEDSALVDDARIQIAKSSGLTSLEPKYDQSSTVRAKGEFEDVLRYGSDPEILKKAEQSIVALRERKSESLYLIAQFYERRRLPNSAMVYYEQILKNYFDTKFAEKARIRAQVLFPAALEDKRTGWEQ